MAIANLHEAIQASIMRKNQLNLEITQLQSQKSLAIFQQADVQSLISSEKNEIRSFYRELYSSDSELQEQYIDYTEIPDFEEAIDKITAQFQDQLDELTAWETMIDTQITTNSTELEEINAYVESYKSMLSTNIQEDFNYGLNN